MISAEEALRLVLEQKRDYGIEQVSLLESVGRVLGQPVIADRDFPPYDRITMDGIAINVKAYEEGVRNFFIERTLAAGQPIIGLAHPTNCMEIMTGSVLPAGTDAVIPYEQVEISAGIARVISSKVVSGQNIHKQGTDGKAGDVLVEKFTKINTSMIGLMASVGMSTVEVMKLPRVAVCSTGDELVDIEQQPELHQIRQSNSYTIAAELLKEKITVSIDPVNDNKDAMIKQITSLLNANDVIIFSGAVSKGKFDLLPEVLEVLGINLIFHSVAQRPGKPFLFGAFGNGTVVFGFPGNPLSTFMCYHKYFRPWLYKCLNNAEKTIYAMLAEDIVFKPQLSCFLPVSVKNIEGVLNAFALPSSTSGDMITITKADGFITLPPEREFFAKGEVFEFVSFE